MKLQSKEYQYFRAAVLFSTILALLLTVFVAIYGKNQSFLMINGHYSPRADYFFTYVTFLGDGLIWVPLFLYTLIYRRDFFIAVVAALIICTLITHFGKRVVFEGEPRPLRLLEDAARAVPLMKGRDSYSNSFPSGHTSTAFTFTLLLNFLVKRKFAVYVFPVIAFLVGYSRVYLAQHFVTDVLAGTVIGIISSYLALLIYDRYRRKKREAQTQTAT
ncbi:MAG TPA: phosphatase PAP2 family protein [Flavisolibacter sp.]|jgi:membrane-associated phospholipid phosphatase|nr:phosphatase PAP2 family protein [Flavisolibacter sp.]